MAAFRSSSIERELEVLGRRGFDAYELRVEAMLRLTGVVPLDSYCFATADPDSLVMTTYATSGSPPEVFVTLAVWARALAARGASSVARTRSPAGNGTWLVAHAACTDRGRVALILEPASPTELRTLMLAHYRLTRSERRTTELVLRGRSTNEIAVELYLSRHTIQGHLKAVFDKTNVRSRRQLVAKLTAVDACRVDQNVDARSSRGQPDGARSRW